MRVALVVVVVVQVAIQDAPGLVQVHVLVVQVALVIVQMLVQKVVQVIVYQNAKDLVLKIVHLDVKNSV